MGSKGVVWAAALLLLALGLGGVAWLALRNRPLSADLGQPGKGAFDRVLAIKESISIGNVEWPVRRFDSDTEINFLLTNKGDADVSDVAITCDYIGGASGVVGSTTRVLRQIIRARTQVTIYSFDIGAPRPGATSLNCFVSDAAGAARP